MDCTVIELRNRFALDVKTVFVLRDLHPVGKMHAMFHNEGYKIVTTIYPHKQPLKCILTFLYILRKLQYAPSLKLLRW